MSKVERPSKRGWIVTSTGSWDLENRHSFAAWCNGNDIPEESVDFSPFDVFDVIEHFIERDKLGDIPKTVDREI